MCNNYRSNTEHSKWRASPSLSFATIFDNSFPFWKWRGCIRSAQSMPLTLVKITTNGFHSRFWKYAGRLLAGEYEVCGRAWTIITITAILCVALKWSVAVFFWRKRQRICGALMKTTTQRIVGVRLLVAEIFLNQERLRMFLFPKIRRQFSLLLCCLLKHHRKLCIC